ncbi:hypothetical protein COU80_03855 [Candidatus Peregrinibacteria bacterium CG10_big_fil_rev_8_21_14_0_10_55_24]|nr:MAG: hypothetical protein COU80_03855 [Candidatus Peregrinibacteria bacterium CG10_big_fil_rev_8_21_14_0_10_55_24]
MSDRLLPVSRAGTLLTVGLFALLALGVYGASLENAFVRWDDGLLIYENPAIRAITPETLKTIFTTYDPELYIPLTFFSYQLDYAVGGIDPLPYHLQNLFWHTMNALLVAWFVLLLTKRKIVGLFVGLLFLVHPLHTEAVAWASARKDLLCTFFSLLSMITYVGYRRSSSRKFYVLSMLTLLLALLSKVTAVTLPAIFILLDLLERRRYDRTFFLDKITPVLFSVLFALIAVLGKTAVLSSSTLWDKIFMIPTSIAFALWKLLFPVGLSVLYPFIDALTLWNPAVLTGIVVCALLVVLLFVSWRRWRTGFFGLAFFLIFLSPTLLNFAKGNTFYLPADRYAYAASIGVLLLLALGAAELAERLRLARAVLPSIACVVLVVCGVLTVRQSLVWKDSAALFAHALAHAPQSYEAQNNMGNVQRQTGDTQSALQAYEQAITLLQDYGRGDVSIPLSRVLSNLASAQRESNDLVTARATYEQALLLNPLNPYAHLGLGIVSGQQGQIAEAEAAYLRAKDLAPDAAIIPLNLGALYTQTGRLDEALVSLERAVELDPLAPQAHYNMGVVLRKLERNREAREAYERAVALAPSFVAARINLGILYYERHWVDQAIEQFNAVLMIDPQNAMARSALDQIQAAMQ